MPSKTAEQRMAMRLKKLAPTKDLVINVIEADDFQYRFWIADRDRGLIIGASLNKIGGGIFFVDELSRSDVAAVVAEVDVAVGPGA